MSVEPSTSIAPNGGTVSVDIVISGVDSASPLNAFEFDLDFDPTILAPTAIVDGGYIPAPSLTVESDLIAPDANFALAGLGSAGSGAGVLATLSFDVIGTGTSPLDLNDVKLSTWAGASLHPGSDFLPDAWIADGAVTAIPEPGTGWLLGGGLLGLCARSRRSPRGGRHA